jgi:hypothetical protein
MIALLFLARVAARAAVPVTCERAGAFGFVERAAFAQVLASVTSRSDLPDHRSLFTPRPFLNAGVARIGTDDVLCAMQ